MQKLSSIQDQLNQTDKKRVRTLIERILKFACQSEQVFAVFSPHKDVLQSLVKDYK